MKTVQEIEMSTDLQNTVRIELDKILQHPLFLSSSLLAKFLNFIVTETLAGNHEQLKEYTIATRVFQKPPRFDPASNGIVRVHAKRLRDTLFAYYDQRDLMHDCVISIPKGRYIPSFEKPEKNEHSIKTATPSLFRIREIQKNRIAFLPFKTYDDHISCISFVDSLGEELTRQFASRSELCVLSYYTTRVLSAEKMEIKNLVSLYNVQYLVSGSIRFEQSKIKVFVELIDTGTENQVWSGVFYQTADPSDHFQAVDQIASRLMTDLCKIKSLECENSSQLTEILYLNNYNKKTDSTRRLAGEL